MSTTPVRESVRRRATGVAPAPAGLLALALLLAFSASAHAQGLAGAADEPWSSLPNRQFAERWHEYGPDGSVRALDRGLPTQFGYPGYFSYYNWYGEINPVDRGADNAWGGGIRFAWPGQVRMLVSIDGGTFTRKNFASAVYARAFPLGVEGEFHVPFGFAEHAGISFLAGLQAGMSMINHNQKVIKIIQVFAGADLFVGTRLHIGEVFLGIDFMVGRQFFITEWDYNDEGGPVPPDPSEDDRWWIGFNFLVGIAFH